tara:strand:- start:46 stop:1137 length:1092 start_codon:yes stop_codon:yes gene_type:complete
MKSSEFIDQLLTIDVKNYYGVPDSLMSSLSKYLSLNDNNKINHKIMHNEGGAVGVAVGKYISNKEISAVYLQNSGIGNIVNPIASLTNKYVFSIPVLYIIGWRGEPGIKDEPQHAFQGSITKEILEILDIEYIVLETFEDLNLEKIDKVLKSRKSFALIIKKNFFDPSELSFEKNKNSLIRKNVINSLYEAYDEKTLFISTTGKTSRELYEITKNKQKTRSFFSIGGMGHASSIAYGVAENNENQVVCFDGDGAFLMHAGAISIIGTSDLKNFHYILINNYAHESVGGQPTIANKINYKLIAEANQFEEYVEINNLKELENFISNISFYNGKKLFLELHVEIYSDKNLPRPDLSPKEYLEKFN